MVHGETLYQSQMVTLMECRCHPRDSDLVITAPSLPVMLLLLACMRAGLSTAGPRHQIV